MAILSSTELGEGVVNLIVDHDPRITATNCKTGSLLMSTLTALVGLRFVKLDDGNTTNVSFGDTRDLQKFMSDNGPVNGWVTGLYREALPALSYFPTSVIWWETSAKLIKIVQLTITRDAGKKPTVEQWIMYAKDGSSVITTVSDAVAYTGAFETSRTRTIT